jgi:CRISPR-associated protein Cas4
MYHTTDQIAGTIAHTSIDTGRYSTRKDILQGMSVYSDRLGIAGKIDIYDKRTGILTERKRKIHKIYDGYLWQIYGQYWYLADM